MTTDRKPISKAELVAQLRALGVAPGGVLLVHTALRAAQVLSDPLPLPPHIPESPVGRVHEIDGQVLLLGVGQDANTTLHLAEIMGGAPYRIPTHCTVLQDGQPVGIEFGENNHCCQRFALADDWLRTHGLQAEGPVGHAHTRLARATIA